MTLQECYAALGGDYQDVSSRLPSERLVQKFILRFLDDQSFALFRTSMDAKNYDEAFRPPIQSRAYARISASPAC